MTQRNYRFTVSLVAALAELGVGHAAISPGSRNTPIAVTLAAQPGITDTSHHDERSAGFFALGIGKATGRPAVVTCTSGTAAAELHPAVVEARYGRVPLIAITADRPSELWETGAAQTIDQRRIYGSAAVWSHDLDVPHPDDTAPGYPAALAARMVAAALEGPGPAHLNLRFREPLVLDGPLPEPVGPVPRLHVGRRTPSSAEIDALVKLSSGRRGLIVAGPDAGDPEAIVGAAAALGFPILPDPQSGLRAGTHDRGLVIGAAAALISAAQLDEMTPELVLRLGSPPVSKPLAEWLAAHPEVIQTHVDASGWRDPGASVSHAFRSDVGRTMQALADAGPEQAPSDWTAGWQAADRIASDAIRAEVAALDFPTEPGIAAVVGEAVPAGSLLYVASSMPIRDVALTFLGTDRPVRIAANRGANGIDGLVSSALGAATAWEGPVTVLAGDLSVLHDLTALATAGRLGIPATIVAVDNNGGGIFHFLPQRTLPDVFEQHFGTPHDLDLVGAAAALGVYAEEVTTSRRLAEAIGEVPEGPRVLVVRTDRSANVDVHRRIGAAVARALGA